MSDQNTLELEESVIATLLLDGAVFPEVCDHIGCDDFSVETLGNVYRAMKSLYDDSEPIDIVSVRSRFKLADASGTDVAGPYLMRLLDSVYTSAYIGSLVKAMLEQCRARRVLRAVAESEEMIKMKVPVDEILEKLQQDVFAITSHKMTESIEIGGLMGGLSAKLEGIPTGFANLDNFMVFENGNLVIIAGRPSMGKTALAISMAIELARKDIPVLIFSLEMASRDVVHRIASQTEGLKLSAIRRNGLNDAQKDRLDGVGAIWPKLPIYINDRADWTPFTLRGEIRRAVHRYGVKAVFVDYLGLLHANGMNSKYEEVTHISKELKSTAKTVNIPLIVLHQLNRASEARNDKRPSLGDLRDSGAIEQDADIVIFPFRPGVYDTNLETSEAAIIVAKHRQGECRTVPAIWNGDFTAYYPKDVRHEAR